MGYTHQFTQHRAFTKPEWSLITRAFKKLAESDECKDLIRPETDFGWESFYKHETDRKDGTSICFNGFGEEAHETFLLNRKPEKANEFQFCKTARKPYDLMVTAVLVVSAGYAEDAMTIKSDGTEENWELAVHLVASVLKKPTRINFRNGILHVSSPDPQETAELAEKMEFDKVMNGKKEKSKANMKLVDSNDDHPKPG